MDYRDTGRYEKIKEFLYAYVAVPSDTGTKKEQLAEQFLIDRLSQVPYFAAHPDYFGEYVIPDDGCGRKVIWAFVEGNGDSRKTVVMMHHHDVVGTEDFRAFRKYAYSPDELREKLLENKETLLADIDAYNDLLSGDWSFGRGMCDMKGGGAVQYVLLCEYAALAMDGKFDAGNIIFLSVPDEENLSAGMRAGTDLLADLKDRFGLDYKLMINSEPHQRRDFSKGVFSLGTVGKIMPFVYVRGYMAHAGKVFEGLSPTPIMSGIVSRTDLNMEFSDTMEGETVVPPTWLYVKDSKAAYDVSMPVSAQGCMSVMMLKKTPDEILSKLKTICLEAFADTLKRTNESMACYLSSCGRDVRSLPFEPAVCEFGELYREALADRGESFRDAYNSRLAELKQSFDEGKDNLITATFSLVDTVFDYISDSSPKVVVGFIPPYYPASANVLRETNRMDGLFDHLNGYIKEQFGMEYEKEHFYTGICDLSFAGGRDDVAGDILKDDMPLNGILYSIPAESMAKISMPVINAGPWGKDFHKLTERVLNEDLYHRTPMIVDECIKYALEN